LPYNKAEGTKSITVQAVAISVSVSPEAPWTAGQTVTITATLTKNGSPWPGETISFAFYSPTPAPMLHAVIGDATTGADGKASITWTIPWTIDTNAVPCRTQCYFRASHIASNTRADYGPGAVAYPTRISISAPDTVAPGQTFTISGKLEYESASGVWSPLAGKTVSLYYNTTKITDVTTASDGSYSASASIPSSGTYTLKASYAGEGFALAPALALAGIKLAVPESVKPLITPLAAILVGGIVAIASTRKR